MSSLSLKNLDLKNKKVLVRVDFNVPLDENGVITDSTRIEESLPTIEFILKKGGSVTLLSHLGRPDGKVDPKYSLKPCAQKLAKLLHKPIYFSSDCLGEDAKSKNSRLKPGEVLLLENLRFYPAEEDPSLDPDFAKKLASYGDYYVNDAFGAAHRAHSSIVPLAKAFSGKAASGLLLEKEIEALTPLFLKPSKPFHVIIGGAKISSKLGILHALLQKADALFIGGAMAFTFLKAKGISIGESRYEPTLLDAAIEIMQLCMQKNISLFLPLDIVVCKEFSATSTSKIVDVESGIEKGWRGMDIGPKTLFFWENELKKAHSIFWNGPLGVFEFPAFAEGTFDLATFLSSLTCPRIVGGGDSVAAINQLKLAKKFSHISTGGGASLEFLEKGTLPGIEALSKIE